MIRKKTKKKNKKPQSVLIREWWYKKNCTCKDIRIHLKSNTTYLTGMWCLTCITFPCEDHFKISIKASHRFRATITILIVTFQNDYFLLLFKSCFHILCEKQKCALIFEMEMLDSAYMDLSETERYVYLFDHQNKCGVFEILFIYHVFTSYYRMQNLNDSCSIVVCL